MASLRPALAMTIGAVVAALLAIAAGSLLGYHGMARPVFGGMIGPVTAVVATWIVVVRTFRGNPAALTKVLATAFLVKVVFFTVYVVVMIKLAELPARTFGLSFMAFFIGLYAVEATLFARLFNGRSAGSR
jgi:hypothetical protein